jgi:HEAT repeat protein
MMMLNLVLALSLAFPAFDGPAPADPKRVEAVVTELDTAFKSGKPEDRVRAIRAGMDVLDGKVVDGIARGLKDDDPTVKRAAVEALGRMNHPQALDALHSFVKSNRDALQKDEELYPATLRAIGRHGSPTSIDLLLDDPFSQRTYAAVRARILGLGNIRSEKAVAAIFELLSKVGVNQADRHMDDVRLALVHLTGVDNGKDPQLWTKWWRDQKNYEIPKTEPELKRLDRAAWNEYWDIEPAKGDRAGDGKREKDGGGEKK